MTVADASRPLRKAIVATLRAAGVAGGRVYGGRAAVGAVKPYVSMGPTDVLTEEAQDYEGSDATLQIDAWSSDPNDAEVMGVGAAIRAALHEQNLSLEENQRLVSLTVERTQYLREPDGTTWHAAITVNARTEPTA